MARGPWVLTYTEQRAAGSDGYPRRHQRITVTDTDAKPLHPTPTRRPTAPHKPLLTASENRSPITISGDRHGLRYCRCRRQLHRIAERTKEITATATGGTGTNLQWGLVSATTDCAAASTPTLSSSWTSGTAVVVDTENANTKYACFKATYAST